MSRSSAAQGAAFVSRKSQTVGLCSGFIEIPFVLRALDRLPPAMCALLETSMRRLKLVGWAACVLVFARMPLGGAKGPIRLELTIIGCSKLWDCGLRFPVDFSAAAWLAKCIGTLNVSEGGSNFGRAPPSARHDVRPACKLRPGDGQHPATPRRAPQHF